jgi:hypothetical protein
LAPLEITDLRQVMLRRRNMRLSRKPLPSKGAIRLALRQAA